MRASGGSRSVQYALQVKPVGAFEMPAPIVVSFVAGREGRWRIVQSDTVVGDGMPRADRLQVYEAGPANEVTGSIWTLRGVTSNPRYTNRAELDQLAAIQEG